MTAVRYLTFDVFTDRRFGGNPLAVVPDADGLSGEQMQIIAREFNYSESTFVTASETGAGPRVRIFTPRAELPFAGHPTIGTAIALRELGRADGDRIVLEEGAGPVEVTFDAEGRAEFRAPKPVTIGETLTRADAMHALGLELDMIVGTPVHAGVGLPFPFVELRDTDALAAAALQPMAVGHPLRDEVYIFTRETGDPDFDLRGRLFAPGHGITEDPATGSAAAALAGLLASERAEGEGEWRWRLGQGFEMGRPSRIDLRATRRDGRVEAVHVKGAAVRVMEGMIELD
ncbi:MAG: PhzF family phenazine biosynthesis protein [Geminicoccaceae bacterium]